jgi:sugar-specific transcriptional regulator TrmB
VLIINIQKKDIEVLKRAGLSVTQARVYLALVNLEKSKITAIADFANIDRGNCYRTIESLVEMGLITRIIGRPNKYVAIPLNKCISILLKNKQKNFLDLEIASYDLINRFKGKTKIKKTNIEEFYIIPKKSMFISKAVRDIAKAKKSINCITNLTRFNQAMAYSFNAHKIALENGVLERTIIPEPKSSQRLTKSLQKLVNYPNFQLRVSRGNSKALGACIDDELVGILIKPSKDVTESPLLQSKHPSLVTIYNEYFNCLWNSASDIEIKDCGEICYFFPKSDELMMES